VDEDKFGAWESSGFAATKESEVIAALKEAGGTDVETQTFTLEKM